MTQPNVALNYWWNKAKSLQAILSDDEDRIKKYLKDFNLNDYDEGIFAAIVDAPTVDFAWKVARYLVEKHGKDNVFTPLACRVMRP